MTVLDQLQIKNVVVMGEGAGANIALRYNYLFSNQIWSSLEHASIEIFEGVNEVVLKNPDYYFVTVPLKD